MNLNRLSLILATVLALATIALSAPAPVAQIVGHWGGACDKTAVSEGFACVSRGLDLVTLDVSDPTHPKELGETVLPAPPASMKIRDRYLYATLGEAGMLVIDIHKPEKPRIVAKLDTPGNATQFDFCGRYLYVADGKDGLQIIGITNPRKPVLIVAADLGLVEPVVGIAVSGNTACVTSTSEFVVLDTSDPAHPKIASKISDIDYYCPRFGPVTVSGTCAYTFDGAEMRFVDISDPTSPILEDDYLTLDTYGSRADFAVSENRAYIVSYQAWPPVFRDQGLNILDISDHSNVKRIYRTPVSAKGVAVDGGLVYMCGTTGLSILDPGALQPPLAANNGYLNDSVQDMAVQGQYAYLAVEPNVLKVVDISDMAAPVLKGEAPTSSKPQGIAVSGSYACVSTSEKLQVFDVSVPTAPVLKGEVSCPPGPVAIWTHYACLYSSNRFFVIDLSDPVHPVVTGQTMLSLGSSKTRPKVIASGGYAYISNYTYGVAIVDI